jgi:hypothetical protein
LAADVAGGWGIVSGQGDDQYLIEANVNISTDADLIDSGVQVQVGTSAATKTFRVSTGRLFQLGTSASLQGNAFTLWQNTGVYSYIYGTITFYGVAFEIKTSSLRFFVRSNGQLNCYYCTIMQRQYLLAYGTWEHCIFSASSYVMLYTGNMTFLDLTVRNTGTIGVFAQVNSPVTMRDTLIETIAQAIKIGNCQTVFSMYDSSYDRTTIYFGTSGVGVSEVKDYKTYGLRVKNESGVAIQSASVTITDMFGTDIVETTDVNGDITSQELLNFSASTSDISGARFADVWVWYSPYTIKIEKAGYWTQGYVLDLTRSEYQMNGINHSISLIPLSDFLAAVPLEVEIDSPEIVVEIGIPDQIEVEID